MGWTTILRAAGPLFLAALLAACAGLPGAGPNPAPEPLKPVMPEVELPRGAFFTVNASGVNRLDDAAFARLTRGAAYVLFGEGHAVTCDHGVQARALRAMAGAGRAPVVGLEMVPVDKEPVLEQFSRGRIPVDTLEKAVDWPGVWGYPFDAYRPVFETAAELGLPVAALNLPKAVVRSLSAKGVEGLTPEEAAWMPYQLIPPPPSQRESLAEDFEVHRYFRTMGRVHGPGGAGAAAEVAGQGEAAAAPDPDAEREKARFFTVQAAWDSKMAESAVETRNKYDKPVAVLAGGGHVEYGWGIASRLLGLDPGAPILLVMPWRGSGPVDPTVADVFFHCPETHSSRLGFMLEARDKSALVVEVRPDSPADKAGFLAGDLVTAAGGEPVDGLWSLHSAAAKARVEGRPLVFSVQRGDQRLEISMTVETGGPDPGK
ncbi:MAG: ChaN family lipoprotein [Thermodesulfobacteriota bacterium]